MLRVAVLYTQLARASRAIRSLAGPQFYDGPRGHLAVSRHSSGEVPLSRPCPLACARFLGRVAVVIVGAAGSCQVNACCVVALDAGSGPISCPRRRTRNCRPHQNGQSWGWAVGSQRTLRHIWARAFTWTDFVAVPPAEFYRLPGPCG